MWKDNMVCIKAMNINKISSKKSAANELKKQCRKDEVCVGLVCKRMFNSILPIYNYVTRHDSI